MEREGERNIKGGSVCVYQCVCQYTDSLESVCVGIHVRSLSTVTRIIFYPSLAPFDSLEAAARCRRRASYSSTPA